MRRAIAVLVSRFPKVTETFILREIIELERQGQPVVLVPLIRENASVLHDEALPWLRRAWFTPFLSLEILAANARAARTRPLRYLRVVLELVAGTAREPGTLLRTIVLFPKFVHLAEKLAAAEIRHVHAHFATHPTTAALVIEALAGIGYSFTVHAHDIFVTRALLRRKIARARFVRVISEYNRSFLETRYPAECSGRLRVIHVGVDADAHMRNRAAGMEEAASHADEAEATARLVCVAALRPYKGMDVLIDACARLRDEGRPFHCEVIGDGPLRSRLERSIRRHRLEERVTLLGALPQNRVRERLRAATLFVLPSVVARDGQMEGIPVALMEAMVSGLPVIASRLSGIPELVEHGRTGLLVSPGDARELASAIRLLIEDPWLGRRLGAEAGASVERSFHQSATAGLLLQELDRHNAAVPAEVEALIARSSWRDFRGRAVGVRSVQERRDSRVIELIAPSGGPARTLVLKAQRSRSGESRPAAERARYEFALLCELRAIGRESWPGCRVPRPLHLDGVTAALLMEACDGESLDLVIRRSRAATDPRRFAALLEAVRGAGGWLAEFHARTWTDLDHLPFLTDLKSRFEVDLERCAGTALSAREADMVLSRMDALCRCLATSEHAITGHHGDFWPGNVFVGPNAIEVIDFEGFRRGLPGEDVGYFLAHLARYFALPGLKRRAAKAATAFIEGYRGVEPAGHRLAEPGMKGGAEFHADISLARTASGLRLLAEEPALEGTACGPERGLRARLRRSVLRDLVLEG